MLTFFVSIIFSFSFSSADTASSAQAASTTEVSSSTDTASSAEAASSAQVDVDEAVRAAVGLAVGAAVGQSVGAAVGQNEFGPLKEGAEGCRHAGAPVDDELHETTIRFSVRASAGQEDAARGVGRAFIDEVTRQYTQDIPIWENKRFVEKPVLCDGDGPIPVFRRWTEQFYR